jgi:tRNA dimethylallyltransferase
MPDSTQKTAVLIAGPTASGKSALALRLAGDRNGVIINADAMQVYRELRILTARPTSEEEGQVPHKLYGHVKGAADYSVGHWLKQARREIEACWSNDQLPVITGGTGLYFKALEDGIADIPPIPADIKAYWRQADGDLHARLVKRDPAMAARLNPADRQRITRALEVHDATAKSLLWWQAQGQAAAPLKHVQVERTIVDVDRDALHSRAEQRFDHMMQSGALDEVRSLPILPPAQPIMKAIGVPELMAHMAGVMTLDQATEKAKTSTRNYIKRQLTWWRGQGSNSV